MWRKIPISHSRLYCTIAQNLSELCGQVLHEISATQCSHNSDNPLPSHHDSACNLSDTVQVLLENSVSKKDLVKSFAANPELIQVPVDDWRKSIQQLVDEGGLRPNEAAEALLTMGTHLLRRAPKSIEQSFENLRRLGFTQDSFRGLIRTSPNLLTIQPAQITSRFQSLMDIFTHSDIIRMAPGNPNIFVDDWNVLNLKVHYILFKMGVDQAQIVRSQALHHALSHIKLRHRFLLLTGRFKKLDPKKKFVLKPNPKLSEMVDTSDEYFAKNVAYLSLEEYAVFKKLCSGKEYSVTEWEDDDDNEDT